MVESLEKKDFKLTPLNNENNNVLILEVTHKY